LTANHQFYYNPDEYESERASNSYLMSLAVIMVGMPLPIVNFIASLIFYFSNRKSTDFVRWHCMQTLLAQIFILPGNAAAVYWTIAIFTDRTSISNIYIAYIITILLFNLIEFISTIHTAIETRKGKHIAWWFFGTLTDLFIKSKS